MSEPAAPALSCRCAGWGYDDETCVCGPLERWARTHSYEEPGAPPLTDEARRYMAGEAARVEGYPPAAEGLRLTDRELGRLWLESMVDYCRDKGLIS